MCDGEAFLTARIKAAIGAVSTVLDCAAALRGEGSNAQLHAVALHATITELMGCCIVLAQDRDHAVGIPILVRSMLEALVDLDNLLHDAGYIGHIEAANLQQIVKLLRSAETNPHLAGLLEGRSGEADAYGARLQALLQADKRPLDLKARFQRAGRQNEYDSLYGLLCLDAHNNSAALADRHIGELPDGTPEISFFRQSDPRAVGRRLDFGLKILIESARMIHGAYRVKEQEIAMILAPGR